MSAVQSFENTVGKGEITRNEQFLLFSQCFLPVWRTFSHFYKKHQIVVCSLSVWRSLKLLFGKGLRAFLFIIFLFMIILTFIFQLRESPCNITHDISFLMYNGYF